MKWRIAFVFAACAAALAAQVVVVHKFTSIDYPGSTWTYAHGINDAGDTVGEYGDAQNLSHGFLLSGGKLAQLEFPGAAQTRPRDINSRGDVLRILPRRSGSHSRLPAEWG